jgi:NAD(P)-dependent dehydrogenase (short-subunit alcohol dehydrogenase family)
MVYATAFSFDEGVTVMNASFPCLKDRAVIITGGASGIGAALTRAFATQGAKVSFLDIDEDSAARLMASIDAEGLPPPLFVKTDLTDTRALRAAIALTEVRNGPVRVLINNAARDDRQSLTDIGIDSWRWSLAVNLDHVLFACQAVAPAMARAGGGSIINFSSNNAIMGAAGMAAYVTAKAGIVGLTKALARELGPDLIRVNAVMPGWVMTERQRRLWANPDNVTSAIREQCLPLQLEPEDMCGLVLFLASDASRVITKQVFVADGGRS